MEEVGFPEKLVFSDEAPSHISGKNRHNVRIWDTENPHAILEHERDSSKRNVFCAISHRKIYGPFFFAEVTSLTCWNSGYSRSWKKTVLTSYFNMMVPPSPHYHNDVLGHLNDRLPQGWFGRAAAGDQELLR
jgi:hypothetical protein